MQYNAMQRQLWLGYHTSLETSHDDTMDRRQGSTMASRWKVRAGIFRLRILGVPEVLSMEQGEDSNSFVDASLTGVKGHSPVQTTGMSCCWHSMEEPVAPVVSLDLLVRVVT